MAHDPYGSIPSNLRPTRADEMAMLHIVIDVKMAIRIRHDFHKSAHIAEKTRRLRPAPAWESLFAQSFRPDAKTPAGLAAEHRRLALDAQTQATAVQGNAELGKLLREKLRLLFPDIGFDAATGTALHRLRRADKSVLDIFHPLGVDDNANLIRLLLKPRTWDAYYW
jgi:hypothetical protein